MRRLRDDLIGTRGPPVSGLRTSLALLTVGVLASCGTATSPGSSLPSLAWPTDKPTYKHIVIVIEENKDYDDVIGNNITDASYINGVLKAEGANFTQMYGEEHNSEGNYFWLFSGSRPDIDWFDDLPTAPVKTPNLASELIAHCSPAGCLSFTGYAEGLPKGARVAKQGAYAQKHVPWMSFDNIPDLDTKVNLSFDDFPQEGHYDSLPTVAIVVPDLNHDMHDGSIKDGDDWLRTKIGPYYQWAKNNDSLLIVTFDESNAKIPGLTRPPENRIATIFAGARVNRGDFPEGNGITHVNILRTIEAMYGLPRAGKQQSNAIARIPDDYIIVDAFQ